MTKVLVVDDDPTVLALIKTKLERDNKFVVFEAHNGKDALGLAESQQPDVVLCDMDMPNMDGAAVANALERNKATSGIPVIFLAVGGGPGTSSGKWPTVSKSAPPDQLINAIEKSCRR